MSDTELLDWLEGQSFHLRGYDPVRGAEDFGSGEDLRWNLYNYRTGRGVNAPTVREAIRRAITKAGRDA